MPGWKLWNTLSLRMRLRTLIYRKSSYSYNSHSFISDFFCDCHLNVIVLKNPPVLICCNSSTIISTAAAATSASSILYVQLVSRGRSMTLTDWERGCAVHGKKCVVLVLQAHGLSWLTSRYITATNSEKALVTSSKGAASFCIHLAEQFCRRSINGMHHIIFHCYFSIC